MASTSNLIQSDAILQISGGISVRKYRYEDLGALRTHASNPRVIECTAWVFDKRFEGDNGIEWIRLSLDPETTWMPSGAHKTLAPHEITHSKRDWEGPYVATRYVIALDDIAIGGLNLRFDSDGYGCRNADLGYWIGEEHWGRGITGRVVQAFVPWAFDAFPMLLRIEALAYASNPASSKVLQKAGFRQVGTKQAAVWKDGEIGNDEEFELVRGGAVPSHQS